MPGAGTWFDVARAVGEDLVPERADWVVLHVRDHVVQLVRGGRCCSLAQAGIGDPQVGARLSLALLRYRDGDHEVALHAVIEALAPRVGGDAYGAGRAQRRTRSGVTGVRHGPGLDPRAIPGILCGRGCPET
jgi:hypothetical protein